MTFAAVTLRLALPLPPLLGVNFLDGYRAISWLCWIANLAVLELYLRWPSRRDMARLRPAPVAA